MNLKVWNGMHYHVEADSIQCAADRDGCEVFEVHGEIGRLRILAIDQKEADAQYQTEIEHDPRWCPECTCIPCCCDDDPEDED